MPRDAACLVRLLAVVPIVCFTSHLLADSTHPVATPRHIREEWGLSRGFPGGRIYGITRTGDGYLWIGTDQGLVRFDGSTFRVFAHLLPHRTPIDAVFALAGDSKGNLLISTGRLSRVRLRGERLEELPALPGQPQGPVSAIHADKSGKVLLTTVRQGLFIYDGESFTPLKGTRSDITATSWTNHGSLWIGTATEGLFSYKDGKTVEATTALRRYRINSLLPLGEHGLSIATNKGLVRWDGSGAPGEPFGPANVQVTLKDQQGNLWFGSAHGLHCLSPNSATQEAIPYYTNAVTALFEDKEGNIWAGAAAGLLRLREPILTTYALGGASEGSGGPIFADEAGAVWYANPAGGLVRLADGRIDQVLATGNYTSIAGTASELWLGQRDGTLLRVTPAVAPDHARVSKQKHFANPVLTLLSSPGGVRWVGLQNAGLAEVRSQASKEHTRAGELPLHTPTAIEQGRDGVIWVSTSAGVASLTHGRWRSFSARDGLPPGRINCILADASGVTWVGAQQGLAYILEGQVRTAGTSPSPLQEPILGLAMDRDAFLWILTANHVLRVNRAELLKGVESPVFIRQFTIADGLPAAPPSRTSRSIATAANGHIWMSLGNQLVTVDPARLRQPAQPTPVQFQEILADERPLPLEETVSIPPGHRRTVIRFAGLNLAAPERMRFRYRLSGFDPDWSEPTPAREAIYTNLAPGPYRFEVQASNMDGLWNGTPAAIALYLEPALWQTIWFRVSAFGAILAACAAGYRLRVRAIQRQWNLRFQERIDERTRIARDLHDTLLQSFYGLILRFQAVRDMLPQKPDAAARALESAIDQAAAAITEGRDAVQALRGDDEHDELSESLATIDSEFRSEFGNPELSTRYRVHVEGAPRRLHPVVRDDIYRIAREAVRNAFRHARASQIDLEIRYDDRSLCLRVRDDGAGIDPNVLSAGRRSGHYGLPGMRERATSIGGRFAISSELERGTEIEITIPGTLAYETFGDSTDPSLY